MNTQQNHHQYLQDHLQDHPQDCQIDGHLDHHLDTRHTEDHHCHRHWSHLQKATMTKRHQKETSQMMKEAKYQAMGGQEEDGKAQGQEAHRRRDKHLRMQAQDTTSGNWTEQNGEKGPHSPKPQEKQQHKIITQNSTDEYTVA